MSSGFCGLHIHSDVGSFLDGRAFPDEIAAQAVVNGDDAAAITDHDEVGSHLAHQKACRAAGIKPIFGTEARWLHSVAASKDAKTSGHDTSHIVLLAENLKGLSNMWALSSLANEPKYFYGKPQLEVSLLREYSEGLWASDGCLLTRFSRYLYEGKSDKARQEIATLLDIFGDHFYMELHTWQFATPADSWLKFHGIQMNELRANDMAALVNQEKVSLAKELSIPLVVVNDAHYAREDQWKQHQLVWQMNTFKGDQTGQGRTAAWMMNTDEITYWMGKHGIAPDVTAEAIKNTGWIADQCNVEINPYLEMPLLYETNPEDEDAFLKAVVEGFGRKIVDNPKVGNIDVYADRLDHEVSIILSKRMAGYFNVVADYTTKAKDGSYIRYLPAEPGQLGKPISPCLCGPGRGFGGGSLVNYLLDITSLDPIHYDLMFERFMDPDRNDPPDIDVDFPRSKRPGVKQYLGVRYGQGHGDRVVSIGTRNKPKAKQLLANLGRVLIDGSTVEKRKQKYDDLKAMSAIIEEADPDEDDPRTWDEIYKEKEGSLRDWAGKYPELFRRMGEMKGLTSNAGIHPAGVIVSNQDLLGYIPTRRGRGKDAEMIQETAPLVTQFDMYELEWLGGVKDDLLGIRHLDTLEMARELVYERHGVWLDYDGSGIGMPENAREVVHFGPEHYADPKIWEPIHQGQTLGIFQIGTADATRQTVRFKPKNERDVADLIAINRPGVIRAGLLDEYLDRRQGKAEITFDHPMMEDITGHTYGVLVYQEDLIKTARQLAGFTAGESQWLRKVIGKKLDDEMAKLEPKFISGCLGNYEYMYPFIQPQGEMDEVEAKKVARKIWASLRASGQYAFNKSHAMGYAVQSCWEVWTKHYYYDEWVAACLATDDDEADRTVRYVAEARRFKRPFLAPDVNESRDKFALGPDGIRYGLANIRDIGDGVVADILKHQPFTSIADYLNRCSSQKGGKKQVVENLIKIGAFDNVGTKMGRDSLMEQLYYHRAMIDEKKNAPVRWSRSSDAERQTLTAARMAKTEVPFIVYDEGTVAAIEQELVGTYITNDPLEKYNSMIEAECIAHPFEIDSFDTKDMFAIGGLLSGVRPHLQKPDRRTGIRREMAFLTVQYRGEDFEFPAFADAWAGNKMMLVVGSPVVCVVTKLDRGCHLTKLFRLDYL